MTLYVPGGCVQYGSAQIPNSCGSSGPTVLSRIFPSTNGPSAATANGGPFINGVQFQPIQGGQWLQGYYFWCCQTGGQLTGSTKAALWQAYSTSTPFVQLVPGSVASVASLVPNTWNFIPLATPILLTFGSSYIAAVGVNGPTPITQSQFGPSQPFTGGIASGSVFAYGDAGSAAPSPWNLAQGVFDSTHTDPSLNCPLTGSNSSNFWVDVQLSNKGPFTSYRLWNASGALTYDAGVQLDNAVNYDIGTEIQISRSVNVHNIWFFSPPGALQLPTVVNIWKIGSPATNGTLVYTSGSPAWSGAAASGWISSAVTGVSLPAGNYRVSVYNGAGTPTAWSAKRLQYWGGGNLAIAPAQGGITCGPLYAPPSTSASLCFSYNNVSFTEPGQNPFSVGPPDSYPNLYVGVNSPGGALFQNYFIDLEVV